LLFFLSQLNEEENRENIAASPEGSTSGEDSSDSAKGVQAAAAATVAAVAAMRAATTGKLPGAKIVL
jgi:hypothetical protein